MKKLSLLLSFFLMLGFFASNVYAGPYFSGNLGIGLIDDLSVSDGVDTLDFSFDPGFGASVAFGHAYNTGARAELEFSYLKSDVDEVTLVGEGSASLGGDGTLMTMMLNGYYDFMPTQFISPFLGAGIGYANADLEILGMSEDDDVFAYQAIAGAAFTLTDQLKFDIQYRYFDTEDLDFDSGVKADSVNTHNFLIGLRYGF